MRPDANEEPKLVPHPEDVELARRAKSGDPDALHAFVDRMLCVRRFHVRKNEQLGRPLGPEELEDSIQDTLFELWNKLEDYEGRAPLEGWAYRFSILQVIARIRRKDFLPRPLTDFGDHAPQPADRKRGDAYRFEQLYRSIERVGPPGSDIIRMRMLEQRSFEEIAASYGSPVNSIKTRFYRAMTRLRDLYPAQEREALSTRGDV